MSGVMRHAAGDSAGTFTAARVEKAFRRMLKCYQQPYTKPPNSPLSAPLLSPSSIRALLSQPEGPLLGWPS